MHHYSACFWEELSILDDKRLNENQRRHIIRRFFSPKAWHSMGKRGRSIQSSVTDSMLPVMKLRPPSKSQHRQRVALGSISPWLRIDLRNFALPQEATKGDVQGLVTASATEASVFPSRIAVAVHLPERL